MSGDKAFIDTNVFAYLYSVDEAGKKQNALTAINIDGRLEIQVVSQMKTSGLYIIYVEPADFSFSCVD